MNARSLMLVLALTLIPALATADVLLIEAAQQDASFVKMPQNGMTMKMVEKWFGTPSRKLPPVGDPPITRWEYPEYTVYFEYDNKRVFDLVKDFGTSESPKSTRSSTTHWCPGRPGHPAFRHNIASSLRLHTGLPYDWTPRSDAPLGSPLAPSARRVSRVASRLPGTTRLRFALHGGLRVITSVYRHKK